MIELEHVSASEGDLARVDDLSLTVRRGEVVALVGANTSGKGLALKLCAGLEVPASGTVRVLGVNPATASAAELLRLRQRAGFVFAQPALISNLSVYNNVALPLRYHTALPESEVAVRVMARLTECGVAVLRDRLPADLPIGEARLAALARAMVMEPEILFVDEMLFGLDANDLLRLRRILERYQGDRGLTIVTTINAATSLFTLMDRLVLLREGRLVTLGRPAETALVDDPMVQDFFSSH